MPGGRPRIVIVRIWRERSSLHSTDPGALQLTIASVLFSSISGAETGGPLSPLLFDFAANGLAIIMGRAKQHGFIEGLVSELMDGGLILLQYADDTVFFIDNDIPSVQHFKFLLNAFEHMSGLKKIMIRANSTALVWQQKKQVNIT